MRDAFVRTPVRVFRVKQGLIEGMAKKRGGRPSLYKPEYAELARKLRLFGATDEQIAWFFEVDLGTMARWAMEEREFFDAITPTADEVNAYEAAIEHDRQRRRARYRRRSDSDSFRLENSMRSRLWAALRGRGDGRLLSRLGFDVPTLKLHLERQFLDGMTWENYGAWHVDHRVPCAAFDMTDEQQFKQCWALENLRPLWAADNIKKGAKVGCA